MSRSVLKIFIVCLLLSMVTISACLKDITVDLPAGDTALVVDGYINLDEYPVVFLSNSMAYFQDLDTTVVNNLQITGQQAKVVISNGQVDDTLQYLPINRWPYYCFRGTKFVGQINTRYDLKIVYDGATYTSTTTIPDTVRIDTVQATFVSDTLALMQLKWTDPASVHNYYTIHIKNQFQNDYYRPYALNHILSDEIADGKEMSFAMVVKGHERNAYFNNYFSEDDTIKLSDMFCFKIGDSVSLRLSNIDVVSYKIWESWYRNWLTDSNPFTNPASVLTNINAPEGKRAKGFWIGYGCDYSSVYLHSKDSVVKIGRF